MKWRAAFVLLFLSASYGPAAASCPPNGSPLTDGLGNVWSWGPVYPSYQDRWEILWNGEFVPYYAVIQMVVDGGRLFILDANNNWQVYAGGFIGTSNVFKPQTPSVIPAPCPSLASPAPPALGALLPTLDGNPVAGPTTSDCQPYIQIDKTVAINCPIKFIPVTAAGGVHMIQPNEWGTVLVASGGVPVQFLLPTSIPTIGKNIIGFGTDSATGFSVIAQPPQTMQGSALIVGDELVAPANANGTAGLSGNVWQVDIR